MPADNRSERFLSLLKAVSRSFYLSLKLLPASVGPTLSLAYLLARASDSIADVAAAEAEARVRLLRGLPGDWPADAAGNLEAGGQLPAADRLLLNSLPGLLEDLRSSPDRSEIEAIWATIREGQIFDIERFSGNPAPLEFDEACHYTGLVAGCVGTFWTDVCFKHVPGYAVLPAPEMRRLGFSFGCGLQWVNILRDRHADADSGRVYVREEEFLRALGLAHEHLRDGTSYAAAVRPRRLRAASALPLALGKRTLDLVEAGPQLARVKVGRWFVWRCLLLALSTTSPR